LAQGDSDISFKVTMSKVNLLLMS